MPVFSIGMDAGGVTSGAANVANALRSISTEAGSTQNTGKLKDVTQWIDQLRTWAEWRKQLGEVDLAADKAAGYVADLGSTADNTASSVRGIGTAAGELPGVIQRAGISAAKYLEEIPTWLAQQYGRTTEGKKQSLSTDRAKAQAVIGTKDTPGLYAKGTDQYKQALAVIAQIDRESANMDRSLGARAESAQKALQGIDAEIAKLRGDFAESYEDQLTIKLDEITKRCNDAGVGFDELKNKRQAYTDAFYAKAQRDYEHADAKVQAEIAGMEGNKELERSIQLVDSLAQKKQELLKTPPLKLIDESKEDYNKRILEWAEKSANAWGDAKKQQIEVQDMQTAVNFMKELEQMLGSGFAGRHNVCNGDWFDYRRQYNCWFSWRCRYDRRFNVDQCALSHAAGAIAHYQHAGSGISFPDVFNKHIAKCGQTLADDPGEFRDERTSSRPCRELLERVSGERTIPVRSAVRWPWGISDPPRQHRRHADMGRRGGYRQLPRN